MKCTSEFSSWINSLDHSLRLRIDARIQRLNDGNPGLSKRFDSILEIKWKTGAMGSFRLYCTDKDGVLLILGGHKDTQSKDIKLVKKLLEGVSNGKTRIKDYE